MLNVFSSTLSPNKNMEGFTVGEVDASIGKRLGTNPITMIEANVFDHCISNDNLACAHALFPGAFFMIHLAGVFYF